MSRPPISNDPRAVYMRQWIAKNRERAREISRESRQRAQAADPEGYRERRRERYAKWLAVPGNREKERERKRQQAANWRKTRRGLSIEDRHAYWEAQGGLCDFCAEPYVDPALPDAWRVSVVDHEHGHCARSVGCIDCVRGQGHRVCNVIEGAVRKALALGLLTSIEGRLLDYIEEPPMRKWLEGRREAAPEHT